MLKIITLLILSLFTVSTYAQELSLKDIQRAACRVRVSGGAGSGTVIAHEDNKYWILTNDHVTGGARSCTVEFFDMGYKSKAIPGQVVFRRRSDGNPKFDMSLISIDDTVFGSDPNDHPIVIPVAPKGTSIASGTYIYGAGCPQAAWLYSWQARVESVSDRILFPRGVISGESGSGILSTVDGNTNLIGIVTWSIGGGGQSIGGGVPLEAIHKAFAGEASYISSDKIPDNYKLVSATDTKLHAKGSDGKMYDARMDETGRRFIAGDLPVGVRIIAWTQCQEGEQCPNCPGGGGGNGGGIFGGRNGSSPVPPQQGGGSGGVWGNKPPIGIEKTPETKPVPSIPKVDDKKIKELEDKITALTTEIETLKTANKTLTTELDSLKEQLALVTKEKNDLKTELEALNKVKTDLDKKIEELGGVHSANKILVEEKALLTEKSSKLDEALKALTDKLGITQSDLDKAKEDLEKNKFPDVYVYITKLTSGEITFGQFLMLALGGALLWWLKNKYGTSTALNLGLGFIRIAGKKYLLHKTDEVHIVAAEDSSNDEKKKINDKVDNPVYNNIDPSVPVKAPIDVTINNNVVSSSSPNLNQKEDKASGVLPEDYTSEYIKGWALNKEKDGENVEKSALFACLYREAMQKLRKGEFIKDNYPLNFQKIAADKIDEFVKNKFHLDMTLDKLTRDQKYNEAMIAFLYKEAVELLRQGKFEVLGHANLADAVESWVKEEFYRRLGIKFK